MNVIIVGAGEIGIPLIRIATQQRNEVVVVEQNEKQANRAASEYDCLVIHDDATVKDTLLEAGAEDADALVSTTDQDATNIMVCLLGNEIGIPNIVSVVRSPDHMNIFRQMGVHTIENPQNLIAEYLYRAVKRPAIIDFMRLGDEAEVFEIAVAQDAPIAGKTLQEADNDGILPDDMLIIAIEEPEVESPTIPRGGTRSRQKQSLRSTRRPGPHPKLRTSSVTARITIEIVSP